MSNSLLAVPSQRLSSLKSEMKLVPMPYGRHWKMSLRTTPGLSQLRCNENSRNSIVLRREMYVLTLTR